MNNFILYQAKCLVNNKIYFGIASCSLSKRKAKHKYSVNAGSKVKFHNAIRFHGLENFEWTIILSGLTKDEACRLEIEYIEKFNTFKTGYNSTKGGEGAFGYKWDKELHKKYTEERKSRITPEFRKKQSETLKKAYKEYESLQENNKKLIEFNKYNRQTFEQKRVLATTSREAIIKRNETLELEEFLVFDFTTKEYIGTWFIKTECAKALKLCNGKISSCLNGDRNFHKTYIFKYKSDTTVIGLDFNEQWLLNIKRKPNEKK